MKAQVQIPTKISLKAISMILITMMVLQTLVLIHQYVVTQEERKELRLLIDAGENLLSDECWTEDRKGVFIKERLDSPPCTHLEFKVTVETEEGESWEYGSSQGKNIALLFPCVVDDGEKKIACRMVVKA